jgi:RNA polymerase sigma factor (sigma-70 family)
MTLVLNERAPDAELWHLVRQGSVPAFEVVVRRHQSLVCAVAYNACGDLATSEDVAQETFWTAWRQRAALQDPQRLRAWLCGIARNLGKNARRRAARAAGPLDDAMGLLATAPQPPEQAVSREEEALVWRALAQIPEAYREPLILFYREGQAVAELAEALDLSPDAVKQRLSRGRGMLRAQVAELVEGALRRSRPGHSFAVGVLSGLTTAAAKGAGAALPVVGAGLMGGLLGGLAGTVLGLAGGWFGAWLPAQLAETRAEREFLMRTGRRMLFVSIGFAAVLLAGVLAFAGQPDYLLFWAVWMVTYLGYVAVESVRAAREMQRLRVVAGEPNDSPLRRRVEAMSTQYRGRVYRSRVTLFGLPLIDVNFSDLVSKGERRKARGWIAVGDDASGMLLAVGGKACGLVAIGGVAVGGLSVGGVAAGLVAVGGLAVGVVSIGGLALGIIAIGGVAIGWQAVGGVAVALASPGLPQRISPAVRRTPAGPAPEPPLNPCRSSGRWCE